LLLVGHLPVRGNLWLAPYADAVAISDGPTALLRLDGPGPTLQLLRAATPAHSSPPAVPAPSTGDTDSLPDALNFYSSAIDVWIVRAPSGVDANALRGAVYEADRITILTSGDEAAIVAAYQIIKDVTACADDRDLPPISLAMVGCDAEAATQIISRLNRTTSNFLGVEVGLGMCIARMQPGTAPARHIDLGGGAAAQRKPAPTLDHAMQLIAQAIEHRNETTRDGILVEASPPPVAGRLYPKLVDRPDTAQSPALDVAVAAEPKFQVRNIPADDAATSPPRVPVMRLAPKPAASSPVLEADEPSIIKELPPDQTSAAPPPNACAHQRPEGRSLSSWIEGLEPLPVRPPGHKDIEIAIDSDGRIHLLGYEQTLREMQVVRRWARDHHELLTLVCPQHREKSQTPRPPICHIFTDRPDALADLHGADFCLHVLAPVNVNGQTAWYSAPLNRLANCPLTAADFDWIPVFAG
jgi:hypothetical protein